MYEKTVPAPPKAKRDRKLTIAVAAAAVVMLVILVPLVLSLRLMYRYHGFTQDLAESFVYGEKNGTLTLVDGGGETPVPADKAGLLFASIMNTGLGRPWSRGLADEGLTLRFGEGSTLQIWPVEITAKNRLRDDGVRFLYTRADGSSFGYDTDRLSYADVLAYLK